MRWHTAFPNPITLRDGRVLASLGETGKFILELPPHLQDTLEWRHAATLLLKAVHSGAAADIFMAMMQTRKALRKEGML